MNPEPKMSQTAAETGTELLIIDGCKVTIRYSTRNAPNCVAGIKSLLLSVKVDRE